MKDNHHEDAPIRVSLETLARHIAETPRNELAALRAAFDRQISSIEARLEAGNHQPAIDATVKIITEVIDERLDSAEQRTEASVTQALAASAMLRKALDNAQQQLESANSAIAAAEAERKAIAAEHRESLSERKKLAAALTKAQAELVDVQARLENSQQETEELAVERLDLQRRLKDVTAAKASAERQYQQLVVASQKLTDGLSQALNTKREQVRGVAAAPPAPSESADDKAAGKISRLNAPSKSAPSPVPTPAASVIARKKPLQFSERARDAQRVRIRRGTHVSVEGIPGELVDLSVGGAQAVLRQMLKPNQLARLVIPTAAGQLICKGRIVWVLYEQPGTSLSVYRLGVKFTDVDVRAVEDFMKDFCEEPLAQQSSEIA